MLFYSSKTPLACGFPPLASARAWPFCLLSLRLPTSTLFPYTTLFRSLSMIAYPLQKELVGDVGAMLWLLLSAVGVVLLIDRKGTRLNSSHEWSSYAVFCLKKKRLSNPAEPRYRDGRRSRSSSGWRRRG